MTEKLPPITSNFLVTNIDDQKKKEPYTPPTDQEAQQTHQKIIQKILQLPESQYGLTSEDLGVICNFDNRNDPNQLQRLEKNYGGPKGIALNLRCHPDHGINRLYDFPNSKFARAGSKKSLVFPEVDANTEVVNNMTAADGDSRKAAFGENMIPPPPSPSIFSLVANQIREDVILKVLIVGAVAVVALGTAVCPSSGWVEGVSIFVAVVIVLTVTAGNDWSKERKFKKLLLLQSDKRVKVIRGGVKDQISSWDLLVGDLVEVVPGDEIPVDGILWSGMCVIDESPLTGETLPVRKKSTSPFIFSGCQVNEGTAIILTTAVGEKSSGGQIQKILNESQGQQTVLQEKLSVVAVQIGKVGVAAGTLTFLALVIRLAIAWASHAPIKDGLCGGVIESETLARLQQLATYFVIGITVVVVAVPEGLPLAVTISLAFSMFKMMKEKCFVRQLEAAETMGQATCICTDKTGTLTENRMTAVKLMVGTEEFFGNGSGESETVDFGPDLIGKAGMELLVESICVNSTCFIKYKEGNVSVPVFVGSATEGALLLMTKKFGVEYSVVRENCPPLKDAVWEFNSARKRMSTLVVPISKVPDDENSKFRLYTKGASEIILGLCNKFLSSDGTKLEELDHSNRQRITKSINDWASQGLRTFALAYKNIDKHYTVEDENPEHTLTFIALVGIKDPVRKEVPGAVAACIKAGLIIKMVTGDNIQTACKIARECGILTDGLAMEGPDFRVLSEEKKMEIVLNLQVLARSSPTDKFELVSLLRRMKQVVAVTGDGTNDAPALKEADVGFSMGISGTQIAINASDIVLLDDNFVSLVSSIKWGRNVLNSVRKFLQFQLGVNLVAITLTFVGAIISGESPLNTVQLLWVNLIMDTLGALALASDEPGEDILLHPPHSRTAHLIAPKMREFIAIQVVYQVTALLILLIKLDEFLPGGEIHAAGEITKRTSTVIFCSFVYLQMSNIMMSRVIEGDVNFLKRIAKNYIFMGLVGLIVLVQTIAVIYARSFFGTVSLGMQEWYIVIFVTFGNFPFTILIKLCVASSFQRTGRLGGAMSQPNLSLDEDGQNTFTSKQRRMSKGSLIRQI